MKKRKIKIIHIINNLSTGGAEKMLFNLVSCANINRFDIVVFSLQGKGELSIEIEKLGIPIFYFDIFRKRDFVLKFLKLILAIIKLKPDLVQTWLYQSNIIGGVATMIGSSSKIIWSLHATILKPGLTKKSTKFIIKLSSILSGFIPDKIICCSQSSYNDHKVIGFKENKMLVIPNGTNLTTFNTSNKNKLNLINRLKLGEEIKFIGMVGRYHHMKRHDIFFHAAKIISDKYAFIHFIICGSRINNSNQELMELINLFDIGPKIHLLDNVSDMNSLYPTLIILTVTSSYGEAFPLSICEAMACKIPVISTDVGDSRYIINNKDMIIPINEPMLLAEKWEKVILLDTKSRNKIGEKNRARIKKLFDIKNIGKIYESHYLQLFNNI